MIGVARSPHPGHDSVNVRSRDALRQDYDGVYVAYQVSGSGPLDLLTTMGHGISVEDMRAGRAARQFIERLGRFARVIRFDRRGTGLSDAVRSIDENSWEEWVVDAEALLVASGAGEVYVLALDSNGSRLGMMLAATSPRVRRLVLFNPNARATPADTNYPLGQTPSELEKVIDETLEERLTGTIPGSGPYTTVPAEHGEWRDKARRCAVVIPVVVCGHRWSLVPRSLGITRPRMLPSRRTCHPRLRSGGSATLVA